MKQEKKIQTVQLVFCALMAAVLCILGPISIPIGPIPVSLTNLVLFVAVYLLGTKMAMISLCIYLILGMIGLPVFSGFSGGLAKLAGPTGGYLAGFLLMVLIVGLIEEKTAFRPVPAFFAMILGTAVLYLFGTVWFVLISGTSVGGALAICVIPFLPFDLIKMVLAILVGRVLKRALQKAGYLRKTTPQKG